MECEMCGQEVLDPANNLRPVREVIDVPSMSGGTEQALGKEFAVCEDCYPEASEPEMHWRLMNECGSCWSSPCVCGSQTPKRT